ncbi:MAG: hypothetical protein M3Q72_09165 [Actinomycetota bacterium]|nr:hypothetical protein [Actinomycetota bacterium]
MGWLAVVFAVIAVAAIVAWFRTRQQLDRQRALTVDAERRISEHTVEIAALSGQLDEERTARTSAEDEVKAIEDRAATVAEERDRARGEAETAAADHHAASERATNAQTLAEEERRRAAEAERRAEEADRRVRAADEQMTNAAERAALAEQRLAQAEQRLAAVPDDTSEATTADGDEPAHLNGGDEATAAAPNTSSGRDETGEVLWALELTRSARTWRNSVAVSTDEPSVLDGADDVLLEALNIEVDAAREEVGAVVELDADIPDTVNPQGSLVALRATQELLNATIRRSDITTIHVRGDGSDLVVTVDGVDDHDEPIAPPSLTLPPSSRIEAIEGGVRIHDAID